MNSCVLDSCARPCRCKTLCAFGSERNSFVVVTADGEFYKCTFDPEQGVRRHRQIIINRGKIKGIQRRNGRDQENQRRSKSCKSS